MIANNVIQFPNRNRKVNLTEKEVASNINVMKSNHVHETLAFIIPQLFKHMELAGFNIVPESEDDTGEHIKDSALVVESIRSLLLKYYEIKHPFQDISENIFTVDKDGSFTLVKELYLEFDPSEFD